MPSISETGQLTIKTILDSSTASETGVQGLVFCVIDKAGNFLTQQCSGVNGFTNTPAAGEGDSTPPGSTPVSLQTVFWLASCTKLITGIAAMQLVEQGRLDLESPEALYKILPELKDKMVLETSGKLVPKQTEISLRMLLDHTAGFGYSFLCEKLRDYVRPKGLDELSGDVEQVMAFPLINQPGSRWEYGLSIDWVGIAVERVSGMKLDDYFQKNIFEPLGIKEMGFFPTEQMRRNLITCLFRYPDGRTEDMDHPWRIAIGASPEFRKILFQVGGAGCFGKPSEYCQILAMLLNNGTSPTTKAKILNPETIELMMKNSIPQFPDFGRIPIQTYKAHMTNSAPEMFPQPGNPPQGWGLTFFQSIEEGPTGRGPNTIHWSGIANTFWWVDRARGIAGTFFGQVMPFGDHVVLPAWVACEKAVYDHLS